ncbi:MAG: FeoA family protein [Bacillota bacterium]|nr:FeoA family protein [Bacillota bacterium]
MMPLNLAQAGDRGLIDRVGGSGDLRRRLEELGFTSGQPVHVLSSRQGDLIVDVRGSRIALGRDLARRVHIRLGETA